MVYTMVVGGGGAARELGVARKLGRLLKAIEVSTYACANWELCFLPTFFPLRAHCCHSTVCIHMNVVLYQPMYVTQHWFLSAVRSNQFQKTVSQTVLEDPCKIYYMWLKLRSYSSSIPGRGGRWRGREGEGARRGMKCMVWVLKPQGEKELHIKWCQIAEQQLHNQIIPWNQALSQVEKRQVRCSIYTIQPANKHMS